MYRCILIITWDIANKLPLSCRKTRFMKFTTQGNACIILNINKIKQQKLYISLQFATLYVTLLKSPVFLFLLLVQDKSRKDRCNLEWRGPNCASCLQLNPLTPNDPYRGRTTPLTSKVAFYIFIQQI
jgi:hypothetical protein